MAFDACVSVRGKLRSSWRAEWSLAFVGLLHRIVVFWRFKYWILNLDSARHDLTLIQLYPLSVYRQHFAAAMWLLQETPPIPHLIVKAIISIADWPAGFTELLFAVQSGITICTACLLCNIVRRVTGSLIVGFGLALWFMLSTDVLILENDFYGETFYENLGMFIITLTCSVAMRGEIGPVLRPGRHAFVLGVLAALAALTRSSLSYFALVPIIAAVPRWRGRVLVAYLAPVLLLQGGWNFKNAILYGHFGVETSSWGGYSAERGLHADNQKQLLCDFIAASAAGDYPDWFLHLNKTCPWSFVLDEAIMPADVQAQDAATRARLGAPAQLNSLAASLTSAEYRKAVARYMMAHPTLFGRRLIDLYPLFWQRMGDYGASFADPFVIDPVKRGLFDLLSRGLNEKQRIMISSPRPFGVGRVVEPAAFGTVSLAPLDAVCIVALHLLFPLLALANVWRRAVAQDSLLPTGSRVLALTTLYGSVIFNAVDAGENMRFRLAIEPALIGLTASCMAAVLALFPRGKAPTSLCRR